MDDTSRYPALSPLARQAGFLGVLPFVAALAGVLSGSTELRLLGERLALGWGLRFSPSLRRCTGALRSRVGGAGRSAS